MPKKIFESRLAEVRCKRILVFAGTKSRFTVRDVSKELGVEAQVAAALVQQLVFERQLKKCGFGVFSLPKAKATEGFLR